MKKYLFLLLALLSGLAGAQTNTFPAEGTSNTFTNTNQFQLGAQLGPQNFSSLPSAADGTILWCPDCQATNPCAGSGAGAFAQREGGAWVCTSSGTSTGGLTLTLTNSPNCTTTNLLVDLDKSNLDANGQATAQTAALSSSHVVGVAISGAGCSGLVQIATLQRATTICDNTMHIGDWVAASSSVKGECTDYGSTKNSAFATIGQVIEPSSGGGNTGGILIGTSDQLGGSNNNGNVLPAGQFKIPYYNQPGTQPTIAGDACTTDGSGHETCNSITTNGAGVGAISMGNGSAPSNPVAGFSTFFTNTLGFQQCETSTGANCIESAVLDARNYGCAQDGSTDDSTCVANMLSAAGSNQSTFLFTGVTYLNSNNTFPTNVAVQFALGGGLKPATGKTESLEGDIIATPRQQIFFNAYASQGTIDPTTGNTALTAVYPEWWGAVAGGNATTNQKAIQAAIIGAFGSNRTNPSQLYIWNRELRFSGQYSVNGTLNAYHMLGFVWTCVGRLGCGLIETASNTTLINGQSVAYGTIRDMTFSTAQPQSTSFPLINIDYNASQGADLATQFVDFDHDNFTGLSTATIGVEISRSGGGAQGNNVVFTNNSFQGFSQACLMIGLGNNGTPANLATNAIIIKVQNGDFQNCTGYGVANYGGGFVDINNVTFEDGSDPWISGSNAQTGYDMYCYIAVAGEFCSAENVRSESLYLVSGFNWKLTNVYNVDRITVLTPGASPPVNAVIQGSAAADGVYYLVTGSTSAASGLGTTASPLVAASGSSTTIVDTVGGFTTNAWVGWQVSYINGSSLQYCVITSNNSTTFTCAGGWQDRYLNQGISNPTNGTQYIIEPNWGTQTTSGGITWTALTKMDMGCSACSGDSDGFFNDVFIPGVQIQFIPGVQLYGTGLSSTRADAMSYSSQGWFSYTGANNGLGFHLAAGEVAGGPATGGGKINTAYFRKPLFLQGGVTGVPAAGAAIGAANQLANIRGEQTQDCWLGGPSTGNNNVGTDICTGALVGNTPNTGIWYVDNASANTTPWRMQFDQNGNLTIPNTITGTYHLASPKNFSTFSSCAALTEGSYIAVADSTTTTNGATITGGGGNHVAGYCNGTNWVVVSGSTGGGSGGYAGVNPQTASYVAVSGDSGKLVVMNCSSACSFTLYGSPTSTYYVGVISVGGTLATVSLNSKNLNGAASVPVLNTGEALWFYSDGTNYFAKPPMATSGNLSVTGTSNATTIGNTAQTNTYQQTAVGATGAVMVNVSGDTYLTSFVANSTMTVGHVAVFVTTADNSANVYDIGVYTAAGALLCHTGPLAGSSAFASTGVKNLAFTGNCNLTQGILYAMGITGNATVLQLAEVASGSDANFAWGHSQVTTTSGGTLPNNITPPSASFTGGVQVNYTIYP